MQTPYIPLSEMNRRPLYLPMASRHGMHELDYVYAEEASTWPREKNKTHQKSLQAFFNISFPYEFQSLKCDRPQLFMKMAVDKSIRLSCPGCGRKNFRSHVTARNHFIKERHSLRCSACQRTFQDALGVIQHYQTCNKANNASANVPSTSVPSTSALSPSVPLPSVPSPSVRPRSAMVKVSLQSRGVQTDAFEEDFKAPEEDNEILYNALMSKFLASLPVTNLEGVYLQGKEPRVNALPNLRLTPISTEALSAAFENPVLPFALSTLEQHLILRYLRSRCHSWNRLQAQGYILGSGFIPDLIKNRKHKTSIQRCEFRDTPQMVLPAAAKLSAIAIDCEMVGVRGGRQTLAFLAAINFLTGEVLINRYVNPVEGVVNWRSEVSGVTQTIMTDAVAAGEAFENWREARDKLWEFMDESTVLVGHSLNYDLEVLGMSHAKVVDSAILISETVFPHIIPTRPLPRQWGLKTTAKDFMNLAIQTSNCGHSALEDTYAARDIVIWCITNPEKLKLWAENARRQEEERKVAQKQRSHGKKRSKGKSPATQYYQTWENLCGRDDDSEDINWSDFLEEHGWPRDYDPSD